MTYSERNHPKPQWVIGYTSRYHLLLDLDNVSILKVKWLVSWLQRQYPKVGDCLVVESSYKPLSIEIRYTSTKRPYQKKECSSYHLIFDNNIGYNTVVKIVELIAGLGIVEHSFLYMRYFRGDMTLRVSPTIQTTDIKQIPKIVDFIYSSYTTRRDGYIKKYLQFLHICLRLFLLNKYPKTKAYNSSNSTNNSSKQYTIDTRH